MPILRKTHDEDELIESPLMKQSSANSLDRAPLHSTIHPEKFDMARFSERRDEKESSLKIIAYVIIVIVVGVGLALLARHFMIQNEEETPSGNNGNEQPEVRVININKTSRPDATNAPRVNDYNSSELTTIGSSASTAQNVVIDKLSYDKHVTYSKLTLGLNGISINETLPQVRMQYNASQKIMTLTLDSRISLESVLKNTIAIDDLITNVVYEQSTNELQIFFSEEVVYVVDATVSDISIFVRSSKLEVEEGNETENAQTETEVETKPETPTQPTTPPATGETNYTNDFSRQTQFVRSRVTTNSITLNETFFEDTGSHFELAWGARDNVGDNYVPNTKAELITVNGVNYIEVTIENLAGLQTTNTLNSSNIPFDLGRVNFVESKLESFENGKAIFRIRLKKASDFRLVTEPTVSGQTQVIAIQIKD